MARQVAADFRRLVGSFVDDECPFYAGAVAYQIFFALLPLILLVVGVLGFFLEGDELRAQAARILGQVLPVGSEGRLIDDLVRGRALSVGIGLLGTIWGVTAIYAALDQALQSVFGKVGTLPLVRGRLAGLLFASFLLLLGLLSFLFSFVVRALSDLMESVGVGLPPRLTLELVSPLYGLAVGFLFFLLVYRAVPRRRIPPGVLVVGAGVAALLWEVAKVGFAVWTSELGAFSSYGALALAAGLLTWIYLTALIVLFGAEVIKAGMRSET